MFMSSLKAVVLSILASNIAADSQVAYFNTANSGIGGYVSVSNGWLFIELDLSELDLSLLPGGESCYENGFTYHIHDVWNYDDTIDRVYTNASVDPCSAAWTSGHYDPWQGCGPSSGNQYCVPKTNGCVPGSTYLGGTTYNCTETTFIKTPYACEVGDWSGKYGALYPDENMEMGIVENSYWEVSDREVMNLSVVFHCATTNARAFCAPFVYSDESSSDTISMPDDIDVAAYFDDVLTGPSRVEINTDGTVFIYIDGTDQADDVNSLSCTNMQYTIFETWSNDDDDQLYLTECNRGVLGDQWDPTVQCLPFSGSVYCNEGKLCNDSSYEYNCQWDSDRYTCAPGDLSGKFGQVNALELNELAYSLDDSLSPSTTDLIGKSIAIHCSDAQMLACAKIVEQRDSVLINSVFVSCMIVVFAILL